MDRLACIDLDDFPLQLLQRRHPLWGALPIAVVEQDKPLARILFVNESARKNAVLPGMRYAAGLALAAELCAGVVNEKEIEDGVQDVAKRLRVFSPHVEPAPDDPGVFWVRAAGLQRLHKTPAAWARAILADLEKVSLRARIAVGYRRFFTYALVRARLSDKAVVVYRSPEEEQEHSGKVPLVRLNLSPKERDKLRALGVRTVAELLRLPADGLGARFGPEVRRLYRTAHGEFDTPLQPEAEEDPVRRHLLLDHSEKDLGRLLFAIKRLLDPLLDDLVARRAALSTLVLELKLDRGEPRTERLRPADPTIDARKLLNLVLLRLERVDLGAGVTEVALDAEMVGATQKQLQLFLERRRRDRQGAREAFARLRAEFGDGAVVRAQLKDKHLPEARVAWTPLMGLKDAHPRVAPRRLVRRIYTKPFPLPHRPRHEEDGWQLRGREDEPVDEVCGPFILSGGWWRAEVRREYHFLKTRKEEWLWVFYDAHRRRWYLQGRVE